MRVGVYLCICIAGHFASATIVCLTDKENKIKSCYKCTSGGIVWTSGCTIEEPRYS